jgi:hypothetical protein
VIGRSPAARRRPRAARLLAVCALLCGLFLMHGAPASAAGGCHASAPMGLDMAGAGVVDAPASVMPGAASGHAPHMDARMAPYAPMAQRAVPRSYRMQAAGHGDHCVALQARERIALPGQDAGAGAVAAPAVDAGTRAGGPAEGERWRGPPDGGRELLLRVSVART